MRNFLIINIILHISIINLSAQNNQDTLYLDLKTAVEITLKNNPDLKRVQMNEEILNAQLDGAYSAFFPKISGKLGFTDNFSLPQQLLPGEIFGQEGQIPVKFGVRYGTSAGVELSQTIFNGRNIATVSKLDATKEVYSLQSLSKMEDLVFNVVQLYIQYQITQEQREIVISNYDRIEYLVKIAQAQFDNGIIKKLDVDQLKVNRTNIGSELTNIDIAAAQQMNIFRFYLDLERNQPLSLTEKLEDSEDFPLSDDLLLNENLNYRLLEQQIELTKIDRNVIKSDFLPTLSAFAQYNYTGQSNEFNFSNDKYTDFMAGVWGINLSIPLFDGFRTVNQLQENELAQQQLELDKKNLKNAAQLEFDNARVKMEQYEKSVLAQDENMVLAQELYNVTKISYHEGVAPLTDLLNAETSLKEAQSLYITSLLNYKLAELEHLKVSGKLVQLINSNIK